MQTQAREARSKRPYDHDPEALRWARQAKRFTQKALAEAAGISESYYSQIEGGGEGVATRNAPPHLLDRLAVALNCPVSVLERKRDAA